MALVTLFDDEGEVDPQSIDEAASHAADGTSPGDEPSASADYRRHLARVLVRRALTQAHT